MNQSLKYALPLAVIAVAVIAFSRSTSQSAPLSTPTPMATPQAVVTKLAGANTGEGKKRLIGSVSTMAGTSTYTFDVLDNKTQASAKLYTLTVPSATTVSIPPNTWTPDGKLVFLQQTTDNTHEFLVLKADGSAFKDGEQVLHVVELWNKGKHTNKITNATGWASEELLILNTQKEDGSKGQNYWFNTRTLAFLALSH